MAIMIDSVLSYNIPSLLNKVCTVKAMLVVTSFNSHLFLRVIILGSQRLRLAVHRSCIKQPPAFKRQFNAILWLLQTDLTAFRYQYVNTRPLQREQNGAFALRETTQFSRCSEAVTQPVFRRSVWITMANQRLLSEDKQIYYDLLREKNKQEF